MSKYWAAFVMHALSTSEPWREEESIGLLRARHAVQSFTTAISENRYLAEMVNITTNQLSQFLNEHQNKSFYDFVNFFRLKEFQQHCKNQGYSHLSILGLAYECGFNSKTTFNEGNYRFDNVPIGRASIQISFVGYENVSIANLEITTGRETIGNLEMLESAISLQGVVVRTESNKEKPLNTFASASARTFSVGEAQRYAGASYHVSRLAMNFAGVKSTQV